MYAHHQLVLQLLNSACCFEPSQLEYLELCKALRCQQEEELRTRNLSDRLSA